MKRKRKFKILSPEEVRKCGYACAPLSRILNNDIVRDEEGILRWKPNRFILTTDGRMTCYQGKWIGDRTILFKNCKISMNHVWEEFMSPDRPFSAEEFAKYYMGIGMSLDGFEEVFDTPSSRSASFFYPHDNVKKGMSALEYMIKKHRGKVFKI